MTKSDTSFIDSNRQPIHKSESTVFLRRKQKDPHELIWGIHPVLEILKVRPGLIDEIFYSKKKPGHKLRGIIRLAHKQGIKPSFDPIRFADLLRRAGVEQQHHQGVMAYCKPFITLSFSELVAKVKTALAYSSSPPIILVLDNIQDQHNLGAIIRSGLAAGVTGVIIPKDRSAPLSGTVAKASAGAVAHMDICRVTNIVHTLQLLKKEGLWVYGSVKDAPLSIYQADFSLPLCLVVGSEEKGLRPLVKEQCDFLVSIPMKGRLDSLNASVAAAVILFEIARHRQMNKSPVSDAAKNK